MTTILIIGSSGLVGSRFIELSRKHPLNLLTPTHAELDILDKKVLAETIIKYRPHVIINFSTIIDIDKSEKDRGNRKSKIWQTNVTGVSNIVTACKASSSFLIQVSTDAVFPGSEENPGPYPEDTRPSIDGIEINWYGYTKAIAEEETKKLGLQSAIVRISHPFGNLYSDKDLIIKTIHDIMAGHQIFTDQQFTPTFIDDAVRALWKIIETQKSDIFHVACQGLVTRWTFDKYLAKKLKIKKSLFAGSMKEFVSQKDRAIRGIFGGLQTSKTQRSLNLSFHTWQDALNEIDYAPLRGRYEFI